MAGVEINSSTPSLVIGTFGAQGTLSEEFDLAGYTCAGLLVDNASLGTLTFMAASKPAASGGIYRALTDSTATNATVLLPSGNAGYTANVVMNIITPFRYVRLLSSVAQANATGDSATICKWVVKA